MRVGLAYGMPPADLLELEPHLFATLVAELEAQAEAAG